MISVENSLCLVARAQDTSQNLLFFQCNRSYIKQTGVLFWDTRCNMTPLTAASKVVTANLTAWT